VLAGLRASEFAPSWREAPRRIAEALRDASLEDRMRAALQFVCPKTIRIGVGVGT